MKKKKRFSCHGEAAKIMVPQAQGLDACNPSDLQDNKPLTAKWMKGMGYLSRSQADGIEVQFDVTIEDNIVQGAVVAILTPIYEAEFLGFSYGFRPGRSQHDALDALAYGIKAPKINWILDADISRFSRNVWRAKNILGGINEQLRGA